MISKTLKLGIVGSGAIVEKFIDASKLIDNIELYGFYSRSIEKAVNFQNKYNFKNIYTDLDLMCKDKDLDAVYIASPNALHYEQTIKFLKNKKHVLCEKAFASNSKEVQDMIKVANYNNVVLMEAMRLIYTPNFLQVKKNLNKIGTVRRYFGSYCQYSSRYDKYKEGTILNAFKKELSNGSLMDIGVYTLAPLINLFGKPKNTLSNSFKLSTGVDGQGSVILDYETFDAILIYSKISNSHLPSEIQGEKGSIIIDKINSFSNVKIIYNNGDIEDLTLPQEENDMYYELSEFVNLITSNNIQNTSLDNSLKVMEVMDQIRKDIYLVYTADKL